MMKVGLSRLVWRAPKFGTLHGVSAVIGTHLFAHIGSKPLAFARERAIRFVYVA